MLNLESSSPLPCYWFKHDKGLNHANIKEKENTRKQNIEKHTNEKTNKTYDTRFETHKVRAASILYTTKPCPFLHLFQSSERTSSLASPSVPPCRDSFEAPGIRKHRHAKAPNRLQVLPYAFLHLPRSHAGQSEGWKNMSNLPQFPVTGDSASFWKIEENCGSESRLIRKMMM